MSSDDSAAIAFELAADADDSFTAVVNWDELEENLELGTSHPERVTGIAKRAMAGFDSLASRADLRFQVIEARRVDAPSGYDDFDVVYRVRTTLPEVPLGRAFREAELTFTVGVHITGTRRLERDARYVGDFSEDTILEVTGRGGETTRFWGDVRSFQTAKRALEVIAERFLLEMACRALADRAADMPWQDRQAGGKLA